MGQKNSKTAEPIDSRFLAPQKLYCYNEVDLKKLRRLIKDRKLAPCFYGIDPDSQQDCGELDDCPICFLKFPSINRAVCCHKPICTECFLQVKSLQAGNCPKCPYCKADFAIYYHGEKTAEQTLQNIAEQEQQAQAAIRSRQHPAWETTALQAVDAQHASSTSLPGISALKSCQVPDDPCLHGYLSDLSVLLDSSAGDMNLDDFMLMQGIAASLQDEAQAVPSQNREIDTATSVHEDHETRHPNCLEATVQPQASTPTPALAAAAPSASLSMLPSSWTSISKPDGFIQITTHKPRAVTPTGHDLQAPIVTGLSPGPTLFSSHCIQAARPDASREKRPTQQCDSNTPSSAQQLVFEPAAQAAGADCMLASPSQHSSRAFEYAPAAAVASSNHMQAGQAQTGSKHSSRSNPIRMARSIRTFVGSRSQSQQKHGPTRHSMTAGTSSSSVAHESDSGAKSLASDSFAGFLHQQGTAEHWPLGHNQNALWPETASSPAEASTSTAHGSQSTLSHTPARQNPMQPPSSSQGQMHQLPSSCDLSVGMVMADPTSVPTPSQEPVPGSNAPRHRVAAAMSEKTAATHDLSASSGIGPNDLPTHSMQSGALVTQTDNLLHSSQQAPSTAQQGPSTAQQGPSTVRQSPSTAAASNSPVGVVGTIRQADSSATQSSGLQSMQPSSSTATASTASYSLTGGAVLLQNPDGSLHYVMLTGEDQIAVQLSLQAKQARQAQREAGSTSDQEDSSPEDKALKDRIARGDDILCQLYAEKPDHSQAMHGSHDTAQDATDKITQGNDPESDDAMLRRMRDADAALKAMYARSS